MRRILSIAAFAGLIFSCNQGTTNGATECIDPDRINPDAVCTMDYRPVCGCDGVTYGNSCEAEKNGVLNWKDGECDTLQE